MLHQTYILCYKVLTNASIVPANGYRKPELDQLIDKLKLLKLLAKDFNAFLVAKHGDDGEVKVCKNKFNR